MKYGYTALSCAIKNCAATFGAGSIKIWRPSLPLLEQELLFPSASPDDLWADLATWRRCAELSRRTGPTLTAPPRVTWTETDTTKEEWHALIFEAQDAMALACDTHPAPVPTSPDYGPTGRPSPGRLVRLRLTGRDVPAIIHAVTNDATGTCLLTYADVPASVLDLPMREGAYVIQRAFHAPFGHEPGSGQWDYWPKV